MPNNNISNGNISPIPYRVGNFHPIEIERPSTSDIDAYIREMRDNFFIAHQIEESLLFHRRPVHQEATSHTITSDISTQFSQALQTYLQSLERKPSIKTRMEALAIKKDEVALLSEWYKPIEALATDPITCEWMEKPVSLYEMDFDLSTLIYLEADSQGKRKEPFSQHTFGLIEIQPRRKIFDKFDPLFETLQLKLQALRQQNESKLEGLSLEFFPKLSEINISDQAGLNPRK